MALVYVAPQMQADLGLSFATLFQYAANSLAVALAVGTFGYLWRQNGDVREIRTDLKNVLGEVKGLTLEMKEFRIEQAEHRVKIDNLERQVSNEDNDRRTKKRRFDDRHTHDES